MITTDIQTTKNQLLESIKNKSAVIGIIGLGYVGLPLTRHLNLEGFQVLGFDVDSKKIDQLKSGKSYIKHIPEAHIQEMISNKRLDVTVDFERMPEADCILICVPTPLTDKMEPDLSYLEETTKNISQRLRLGQLVVLESTSYPGTTEELLLPPMEKKGLKVGEDFFLAFSPEREDPGNKDFNTGNIPKVVGGVTSDCTELATALYGSITRVVEVSSTRVAEFTKLLENTYRSVNIAMVNEMKILSHKMGIDLFEVIRAAATKPFGFNPFYPGPGLGGHCIPIDPFYLSWKAKEFDFATRFIHLAGEINVTMPNYVVERTAEGLNQYCKSLRGSNILILGVGYKKDIDDDRESPAYQIMELLRKRGVNLFYNDPFIPKLRPTRKFNFNLESTPLYADNLRKMDAVVIVADHSDYEFLEIVKHSRLVVDTRNATKGMDGIGAEIILA